MQADPSLADLPAQDKRVIEEWIEQQKKIFVPGPHCLNVEGYTQALNHLHFAMQVKEYI